MRRDRCPSCNERVTASTTECPLCGEFIRTRDEAAVLEQQTNLDALVLSQADEFFAAFLEGAELRGASLACADLFHTDLHGADLRNADLSQANLSAADLTQADLSGANLYGADLSEANLCGADLSHAFMRRADFRGARYDKHTVFPTDFDLTASGALSAE